MATREEKIESRKKQALDRCIGDHADVVVKAKGAKTDHKVTVHSTTTGEDRYFEQDDFIIKARYTWTKPSDGSWAAHDLEIHFEGEIVYSDGYGTDRHVEGYAPGKWKKVLESLHAVVVREEKNAKRREKRNAKKNVLAKQEEGTARWGLDA